MRTFIIICLAVLAVITLTNWSTAQSDKVLSVGDCVNAKMDADNYQGDYRLGWEMYAESCQ